MPLAKPAAMLPPPPVLRSARPTLATWLFASVLGATMAAVLTCTLIIDRFVRDEARVEATGFLQANADALRDALDRGMAHNFEEVRIMAQLDQVSQGRDAVAIGRALSQMHAGFPQFTWLGFVAPDGKVLAATDGLLQGQDVSSRPWFDGARHDTYLGDVHNAHLLEPLLPAQPEPHRFVDIAAPVNAPDGSFRGVIAGHLSWSWVVQIKHDAVDAALRVRQAEALILGADGTVLLGPPFLQGRRLPESGPAGQLEARSQTRGSGRYRGLGWTVVLSQPEHVAMAHFRALQTRTRMAALLLCLLLAPLLWLLAHRLARPLRELGERLDAQVAPGLGGRSNPLYREAEVLGQALDRFALRQQQDATRLRELNADLEARVSERTAALEGINDELGRAVRERRRSEEQLRAILTHAPDAYICVDEGGLIIEWNRQAEQTFGWSAEEARGRMLIDLLTPPQWRAAQRRGLAEFARGASGTGMHMELKLLHRDGTVIPAQLSAALLRTDDGVVAYAFLQDISARKNAERLLARSERRLRAITDNMPGMIGYIDRDERFQFCNATYRDWVGREPAQLIGRTMAEALGEEAYLQRRDHLRRALAGERVDFDVETTWLGVTRFLHTTYLPQAAADGKAVDGVYALVTDITAMQSAQAQLARIAHTDALTGLPNRHAFNARLGEALARCRRGAQAIALFFLDVDKFKAINDTFGHGAGDAVLRLFAQRLRASVRETDIVARLAGDEFVVVLEGPRTLAEPQFVARKILAAVNRPFVVDGQPLDVSTSIGIAFHHDARISAEDLLAHADQALYEAKNGGRNTFRVAAA